MTYVNGEALGAKCKKYDHIKLQTIIVTLNAQVLCRKISNLCYYITNYYCDI